MGLDRLIDDILSNPTLAGLFALGLGFGAAVMGVDNALKFLSLVTGRRGKASPELAALERKLRDAKRQLSIHRELKQIELELKKIKDMQG